jgi:hypothetical protein
MLWYFGDVWHYVVGVTLLFTAVKTLLLFMFRALVIYRQRGCGPWIFGACMDATFAIVRLPITILTQAIDVVTQGADLFGYDLDRHGRTPPPTPPTSQASTLERKKKDQDVLSTSDPDLIKKTTTRAPEQKKAKLFRLARAAHRRQRSSSWKVPFGNRAPSASIDGMPPLEGDPDGQPSAPLATEETRIVVSSSSSATSADEGAADANRPQITVNTRHPLQSDPLP